MIFKTLNGDLTVFNNTLISTKDHLKALHATVYNKNGAFNLQGLLVNSSQSVSTFTKLNNAFKAYNGNLSKSTQLQNAYVQAVGKQNVTLGNYLAGLNGAKASMGGYVKSLIAAKAASIGLQVTSIALNTAISMGITLAISALVSQISKWVYAQEEARQKAIELTNSYKEQKDSLDSQIEKYKELKETLDNGNLSTDETRSIKEQLLEIQKSLIESYGDEASNIDLVNGKYREQLGLLSGLSKEKADEYVKENRSAYEDAKKELEKVRTYKVGTIFSYNGRDGMSDAQKQLYDYIKSYSELFEIRSMYDTSSFNNSDYAPTLFVNANADEAKLLIDQFYDDIEKYIKENNLELDYDSIQIDLSKVSSNIETDDSLKEYREIYDEFMKAEVVRNDTLRPLYQQSIQAVEDYNNALSSGEGVAEAKTNLDSVQQSVQNATGELEGSQEVFDGIYDGINKSAESAYNLTQAFENNESVKGYAEQLRGLTDIDLQAINFEDSVQSPGEETFKALIDVLGLSADEVQKLIDKLVELGYVQGKVHKDIPSDSVSFSDIFSLKASDTITNLGKISESIDTIQNAYKTLSDAIDEYNEEGAFSIDTLQSVIALGGNWLDYLVDEDGALKLDKESLEQLTQARLNDMRVQAINNVIDNASKIESDAQANDYLKTTNYALAESYEEVAEKALESARAKMQDAVAAGDLSQANMDAAMNKAKTDIAKINKLFANTGINTKSITGKSSSSSSSSEDFKEQFDFFERRIKVLDNAVTQLKANLENLTGSFAKNQLLDQNSIILEERIHNYSDAAKMYQKKAQESLSRLDAKTQKKIVNGSVSLNDYIGEDSKTVTQAMNDYKGWADKVAECTEELANLETQLCQLELDKFNHIVQDFTDQFDLRDSAKGLIDKQISLFEEAGQLVGKAFYEEQIGQTQKQLSLLENEKAQLVNQLNSALSSGRIQKGTEEWLEMVNALSTVDGNILDCKKSIEEFDNAIQNLHWETFDRVQDTFGNLSDEINNLLDTMKNSEVATSDNQWTAEGLTQLGLYAQQYELATYQVSQYADEIDRLNADYLTGKYSATELPI